MRFLILVLVLILVACDGSRVYEDYVDLEDAFWHLDSAKVFEFEITDSQASHNILATFRNSSAYPFYNIYFHFSLRDSLDSVVVEQLKEAEFFNSKTGQPYGSGLGDLFDHTVPIIENYSFPSPGRYSVRLQQQMRLDSLPFILSVGARVETVSSED